MNTASLLWGWYPRLYPRLRLQWILLLFFEGDIPNYKASHFFNSGKEVWRWWCGSGFLAQDWAERFSGRLTLKLSCMHVCVMLWEEARTMMIITLCVLCCERRLGQWWSSHCCPHESHGVHNELWWCWPVPPQKRKYGIRWEYPQFLQRSAKASQEYSSWWKKIFFMIRKIFFNMRKLKLNRGHIIHCSGRRTPANIRLFFSWPR